MSGRGRESLLAGCGAALASVGTAVVSWLVGEPARTAALRASEERLRLAQQAARMGTWEIDLRTGEVTWFHELAPDAWGSAPLDSGQGSLESFLRWIVPEDRERVRRALEEAIQAGTDYDVEYRAMFPDGSVHWHAARGRVVSVSDGRPARMAGIVMDVSDRRRAEQARVAAEARLHALLHGIRAIVWEGDPRTFRFTFVSEGAQEILGYPLSRWLTEPDFWLQLLHPEDRDWAFEFCRSATVEGRDHDVDYRVIAADGRVIWLRDTVRVTRDAAGEATHCRGVMVDITERKQSEKRERFLATVSEILATSLDCEATLARVAELAVPEVADCCLIDLLDEGPPPRRVAAAGHADRDGFAAQTLASEALQGQVRVLRTRQAEVVSPSCICVPLLAGGRVLGTLTLLAAHADRRLGAADLELAEALAGRAAGAVENTRLYREADAARAEADAANRTKDEFLALVSHEMRAPLGAIVTWAQLLRSGRLEAEKAARALETIERGARAQTQLVDDLLEISRVVMGKLRLEPAPVEIAGIVEAAVDALRPAAETQGVSLAVAIEQVGQVSGDADRLHQVIGNLLSNAIKFTPRAGRVEVRLERIEGSARITVADTGCGIRRDFLPHVFDRFRQAEEGGQRERAGLGIGLAIARHLVELHGGTIGADSRGQGYGATFTVTLPLLGAATDEATREARAAH